jgi:thioesterase domain-containing protein/acyl carrier protein
MPMTALPLTPNGKVDRKALPAPDPGDDLAKEFVAPRDPVEVRLASLWEKVLKVHPVGATTNFFDLGANSLAGARLFTEIGKVFDKDLPVSTLFDAPSVETLANLLRDEKTAARWSSLVAIQPGGSHPPFFCVHGGTGATFFLHDLADNLGTEQPFYGLQMEGMDGRRITRTHIEQMAAHYLSEARTLQPEGPYYLGGYCFGGVVALEMARILLEQGQEVGLLALLNAPNPKVQPSDEFDEDEGALADEAAGQKVPAEFTASKPGHMAVLRNLPRRARLTYLKGAVKLGIQWRVRSFRQQRYKPFRRKFIERASMACAALNRPVPPSWRNFYLLHLTHIAEHHYVTRFYPGTMTIFRGKGLDRDPHVGWQGWVKHIESIEIEGHHKMRASMMRKPLVEKLAEQVRRRLERARREASVSQEAGAVAGSTHQR